MPQEMKKFRGREAEKIREHLSFMIFAHCFFLFMEIMVYNVLVTIVISELFYTWLCYYVYMTLNDCLAYSYIGLMFIAPVTGIFRVLDVGLGLSTLLYLCQLGVYGYCGGYFTFFRFRAFVEAKGKGD